MGIIQKDALRTSLVSYIGLLLGYFNKGFLFIVLLSTEEIGLINLILLVAVLFAQFANFGAFNAVWRFFPLMKDPDRNHRGFLTFNVLLIAAGAVVFSAVLLIFQQPIIDYYSENSGEFANYFYWVIPCGIAILVYRLYDGYLRALYKSVFSIFVNDVLLRVLITVLLGLYAYKAIDFNELVIWTTLVQWVPSVLLIAYTRYIGEGKFAMSDMAISRKTRQIILKYSGYSYFNSLGANIVVTIDALMVAGMLGLSETGVYTTVIYLTRALTIPYLAVLRVSTPMVPQMWKDRNMDGMEELYKKVSSVSLVTGLFLFMGVWVNRVDLFNLLPPEFETGIYVFLFVMTGKLIDMYFGLNGTILITSKKYKFDMVFTIVLMVLVFVLNLILIPMWGMVGAAISTSLAYLLYNVARMLYVWYHYQLLPFSKNHVWIIALFTGAIAFFEFVPIDCGNLWVNLGVKSVLATLFFPAVIYYFNIEPEISGYVDKVRRVIAKRFSSKDDSIT